jgi:hypothetical protein
MGCKPNPDGFLAGLGRATKAVGAAIAKVAVVVLSPLMLAILIAVVGPIRRLVTRRKYLRLAHDMHLDEGTALSQRFRGDGVAVGFYLTGSALREGSWEEVLRTVTADTARLGYSSSLPESAMIERRRDLQFAPPPGQGLPFLKLSVHLPGDVIAPSSAVVPPGHTGLDFTLA